MEKRVKFSKKKKKRRPIRMYKLEGNKMKFFFLSAHECAHSVHFKESNKRKYKTVPIVKFEKCIFFPSRRNSTEIGL